MALDSLSYFPPDIIMDWYASAWEMRTSPKEQEDFANRLCGLVLEVDSLATLSQRMRARPRSVGIGGRIPLVLVPGGRD